MMKRPRPRLALALSLLLCALQVPAVAAQGARNAGGRKPRKAAAPAAPDAPLRLVVQQGHRHFGRGFAAFSPDGRLVATGAAGDVVVWDVSTGREVRRLAGNEGDPGAQDVDGWLWGSFSPDSKLIATSVGAFLRLWDVRTGKLLWQREHEGHPFFRVDGARPPVAFSADGRQLSVNSDTGHRVNWDAATGRLIAHTPPRAQKDIFWSEKSPREASAPGAGFTAKAAAGVVNIIDKANKQTARVVFRPNVTDDDDGLLALAVSPDGRTLLVGERAGEDGHLLRLWDAQTAAPARELTGRQGELTEFRFTNAGGLLTVSESGRAVRALDVVSGRAVTWEVEGPREIDTLDVSPDGRFVATAAGLVGQVWDAQTGTQLARVEAELPAEVKAEEFVWDFAGFTPDATVTFFKAMPGDTPDQLFRLSVSDWKAKRTGGLQTMAYRLEPDTTVRGFTLTRDARAAAWETDDLFEGEPDGAKYMTVWNADPQVKNKRFRIDSDEAYNDPSTYVLSPDGRRVLVATSNAGGSLPHTSIKVWDADQKRALFKLAAPGFRVGALAWSPDGRLLATGADDGTTILWDAATGRRLRRLAGPRDNVYALAFSPDSRHLLALSADGFARLFDAGTGAEVCRLITFAEGSWVVVAPDGRFDADDLEEVRGVHWVAADDPFKPLPLEIFMRDYYEPRLLARLLAGEKFEPVRALADINRAQPRVEIKSVEQLRDEPGFARVAVEVERGRPAEGAAPRPHNVYDLRLFRDGRLVATSPPHAGPVQLDEHGRATLTFDRVRLPRGADAVEFSAYAFNDDRVKSANARALLRTDAPLAATKGRAYVISVGVNAYDKEDWDLRFAANDARRVQELIAARVEAAGDYGETVRVALVSDYETDAGRKVEPRVIRESSATKQNFKAVIDLLAGRKADAEALRRIPNAEKLRAATPEDLVIITFSSHGYADERGTFYLLTYDSGGHGLMRVALHNSVSSDELSAWLRDVDAGEMVFVVDACHSAASVQGEGFKPGPMGSRGLGQLAYDKGMRVLTSTQADDVALEFKLVEMGLLTYALTRDAVERAEADRAPKDRRITVSEWLAYGVERVPQLHAEVGEQLAAMRDGKTSAAPLGRDAATRVVRFNRAEAPARAGDDERGLNVNAAARNLQRPSLFDFRRRRRDPVLARN